MPAVAPMQKSTEKLAKPNREAMKVKHLLSIATLVAMVACALILYRCYVPGRSDLNLLGGQLFVLAAAGWLLALFQLRKIHISFPANTISLIALPCLTLISALALTPIPEQIGFHLSRPELEHLAQDLRKQHEGPEVHVLQGLPKLTAGLYSFDTYALDDNGGVYLVTTSRGDKGLNTSSGFAFKSGLNQLPIGRAYFEKLNLWPDWQSFTAAD